MRMILISILIALVNFAHADWVSTEYTDVDIRMDNGKTYFYGFTTSGTCLHNRLELRETGDYWDQLENSRRIMSLILAARMSGKKVSLGYNDQDGPGCRIAQVSVQW